MNARGGKMTTEPIEMDYTICLNMTPVAQAADFQTAMAIKKLIQGSTVTVTLPSGHLREIQECEPDHRFGEKCPKCGLQC
jgi:hypothetical protein